MIQYHAVMIGECGEEFGVTFEAEDLDSAEKILSEDYPESRVDELRTVAQWRDKEEENYRRAEREYENDYYFGD